MIGDIEEQMLEERLVNWGRWARDPKRQGRSPIAKLAELVPDETAVPDEHKPIEIDLADALMVQRAWQKMPMSPEKYRKAKFLIGVAYAYGGSFWNIRRIMMRYRINLHEREFGETLDLGKKVIANLLRRLDDVL